MFDKEMDKKLNIETTGLIEWPSGVNLDYFRTESSSYRDLERFISEYEWLENSQFVDFGSGKGRAIFYVNYKKDVPTTGIEINQVTYSHLLQNLADYGSKYPEKANKVRVLEEKAEEYQVKETDNIFYFFNPFTVNVFKKVVQNIEASLLKHPRVVDIVLYYPGITFTYYLDKHSKFEHLKKIKNKKYFLDNRECFDIYRYIP